MGVGVEANRTRRRSTPRERCCEELFCGLNLFVFPGEPIGCPVLPHVADGQMVGLTIYGNERKKVRILVERRNARAESAKEP